MSDNIKSAEELGMLVREVWIQWAREQPIIKEHWVAPWERLSEADKDVDRRIGLALFNAGWRQGMTEAADTQSHFAACTNLNCGSVICGIIRVQKKAILTARDNK